MRFSPDFGAMPVTEPRPAGHPTAAVHLLEHNFPGAPCLENQEDASQRVAIVDRLASEEAKPSGFRLG